MEEFNARRADKLRELKADLLHMNGSDVLGGRLVELLADALVRLEILEEAHTHLPENRW